MRRRIDSMVTIVTGASAGIGKSLAEALSAGGAKLALAARRVDRLEALNRELGGGHLIIPTDVANPAACHNLIQRTTAHFGRIDTLVCNAGYGMMRLVAETTPQEMTDLFCCNVLGTTECIRAAIPVMKRQESRDGWRGQIVIVTSAVARRGLPYFGAYAATKAAQLSIAEAMRVELKSDRIAVTTIHPVGTDTEFGDVSAAHSSGQRPKTKGEFRQSSQTVAKSIVRGIERPRPEVWPAAAFRWGVSIGTLFPGVADRMLSKRISAT